MRYLVLISFAALSILGGCCNAQGGGDNPVVSPTVITDEKQNSADPILPAYKPWWVEDK